nr:hypothetical protein [Tanacetum cinerariifolium]
NGGVDNGRCYFYLLFGLCEWKYSWLVQRGHINYVHVIMQAFEDSKNMSDLVPSVPKSTAFFCNVPSVMKASIMSLMPFVKGFLLTELCPIRSMLLVRDIVRLGFTLTYFVHDLISNGSWSWPPNWNHRFPLLVSILVPNVHNDLNDVVVWHDVRGSFRPFSIACVWDSLRLQGDVVYWYHVVWFPHCIPQHVIHMWLVVKEKLKTQDRLRQWDVGPSTDLNMLSCPLCGMVSKDEHPHPDHFIACKGVDPIFSTFNVSTLEQTEIEYAMLEHRASSSRGPQLDPKECIESQINEWLDEDTWIGDEEEISLDDVIEKEAMEMLSFGEKIAYKSYLMRIFF